MEKLWWKEAVVYQVYPRSFMDSNGDGIGDIVGLISKLDYLKELGVDVIWLSPVYKSPNADNGYDISDYRDIMDEFGTLADLDRLIAEMHQRGLRLVMDLVVNHTSDEHPWFIEARKAKNNPYHDYYIWQDGNENELPNNWESHFSGSAWQYDKELGQYYLHIFAKKQPDLNWENPMVRTEVEDICRFWLNRGIDGFRMDVINFISKVSGFPSVPNISGLARGSQFYMNGPHIHEYLQTIKSNVLAGYDIMTVGETPNVTPELALGYVGKERGELNMVFQFEHMMVDSADGNKWNIVPWKLTQFKRIISKWQHALYERGWNSLYLSNHDQPRSVSRFGDDGVYHSQSAKLLATMLHTLQGTPYIYQGEEIGMTNVTFAEISDYRDIQTLNFYESQRLKGEEPDKIMQKIHYRSRDNARTPMQWTAQKNAGFSAGTPWINVNPNYQSINVESQITEQNSIFNYYKQLIALRKAHPIIVYGDFTEFFEDSEQIYAYLRTLNSQKLFVMLNFSAQPVSITLPDDVDAEHAKIYIANYSDTRPSQHITMRPYEALALLIDDATVQ